MSTDAKAWTEGEGWLSWYGRHDGDCPVPEGLHHAETLATLLSEMETCMNCPIHWEIRTYPKGETGLVGWT